MSYLPTTNLQPQKLAVKFNPPTIAIFYKYNLREKKKRRYNIFLNQLAFLPTAQEITEKLFDEHNQFLNYVDFDQVYKMVQLIKRNFKPQQNLKSNYINELQDANSYIESQRDSEKSMIFQNDEEVYYTSYEPQPQNQIKPLRLQEQLQRSFIAEQQPLTRSRFQNSLSSNDKQKISNFSSHIASDVNTQSEKEVWTSSNGKHNKDNLSLSISGMQQFMDQHNTSSTKIPFQKSSFKGPVATFPQRQSSNSPIYMPQINTQLSQDTSYRQQPLIGLKQDENNLNIANFVEEGNLQNQLLIDDQLYESPAPQKRNNKYVQQQINQNQQYYLQQQSSNSMRYTSPTNQSNEQKKKSKVNFLKQISDLREENFQDFLD